MTIKICAFTVFTKCLHCIVLQLFTTQTTHLLCGSIQKGFLPYELDLWPQRFTQHPYLIVSRKEKATPSTSLSAKKVHCKWFSSLSTPTTLISTSHTISSPYITWCYQCRKMCNKQVDLPTGFCVEYICVMQTHLWKFGQCSPRISLSLATLPFHRLTSQQRPFCGALFGATKS